MQCFDGIVESTKAVPLDGAALDDAMVEEEEGDGQLTFTPLTAGPEELDEFIAKNADVERKRAIAQQLLQSMSRMPPPAPPATTAAEATPAGIDPGSIKRRVTITAPVDLQDDQRYDLVTEPNGGYSSYPLPSKTFSQGTRLRLSIYVSPGAAQLPMRAVALLHDGNPIDGFSPADVELPPLDSGNAAAAKRPRTG